MTTKEYLQSKEPNIHIIPEEFLQEYAKIKCKELLEIVAEKASQQTLFGEYGDGRHKIIINKDSILNAVDLETFII